MIIFALLNLFVAVVPHKMLYDYNNFYTFINVSKYDEYLIIQEFPDVVLSFMLTFTAISVIMITVTTVKSMKIYHDRAAMDTLGCLPLSYGERFWGDLSSSVCANFISFIPSLGISLILDSIIKSMVEKSFVSQYSYENYTATVTSHTVTVFLLMMMICYLGVYAVTAFISSCSGRQSSAVVFSLLAMVVIPGIYTVYANFFYSYAVGVDAYWEISSNAGMLPPFGFIFSLMMRRNDVLIPFEKRNDMNYLIERPACFIVPALIIAAFVIGAYYIGKKRRAEKTGEGFVFNNVFYGLLMTLLLLVLGLASPNYFFGDRRNIGLLVILPISFVFYSALEFYQNKSLKGFWKTVVRFAAVFGVFFVCMTAVSSTKAFDYSKNLPSKNSIKEVRVSGDYFFSEYLLTTDHIYKSADSVEAILNEHEKLLEAGDLETGHDLSITYVTKLGQEISRGYSELYDDSNIKRFSDAVNHLEEFDPSVLGIIGSTSDFSGMRVEFNFYGNNYYSGNNDMPEGVIRSDKAAELAALLRKDIENYYYSGHSNVGSLMFRDGSVEYGVLFGHYSITEAYEDTLRFLRDPANYVNTTEEITVKNYQIFYYKDSSEGIFSELTVNVSEDDESVYAKELLSYIEIDPNRHNYSSYGINVLTDGRYTGYYISPENEKAALKAMIGLFREKYVQ